MTSFDQLYIDGAWVAPAATDTIDVVDSVTESVMGSVPAGTSADVDAAVAAAKAAFGAWSATPPEERGKYLSRIGDALGARMDELAGVISKETGMAMWLAKLVQVGLPINSFNQAGALAAGYDFEEEVGNSVVVREPIGVVGCITPWNYPLHQVAAKVAYAMAAGCTVVLKPSEVAPLDAFILAEVIDEVGLPAGVFNLVSGDGPIVGEAIAAHPDVDMVSFTGSTRAGKRVAQLGAETIKKVALELGGKSANLLLDDLDEAAFSKAVADGVNKAFLNSGQTCSALTRMLVPADRLEEAERVAAGVVDKLVVGDPATDGVHLGPLASAAQRERVQGYIDKGVEEGATVVAGGPGAPEGLDTGFFVRPTVFSAVRPDMTIAQEEIFGPVLSIIPYEDEDEAVEIANGVVYGLAGGVWSADGDRALAVARRLRTGQVEVNGGAFNPNAPFGGYKQSGIGREYGRHGLEEFLEVKAIQR
ncbi:MAG: aldehyde dehydrogenase family protein [Acidimicrobiia bacterium]|nr:aldehyde dehydrogenase family protein [Acidimicrobiia bacterium]